MRPPLRWSIATTSRASCDRVPEIVVDDERAQPDPLGGDRDRRERRQWGHESLTDVIERVHDVEPGASARWASATMAADGRR